MRIDMLHLLLESPHKGYPYVSRAKKSPYRAAKSFVLDESGDVCDQFCVNKQPMKFHQKGHRYFEFPRIKPLLRYLRSQVGRPWNDVNSELTVVLRKAPWLGIYLSFLVEVHTVAGQDGRVLCCDGLYWPCDKKGSLYVDPITGRLQEGAR